MVPKVQGLIKQDDVLLRLGMVVSISTARQSFSQCTAVHLQHHEMSEDMAENNNYANLAKNHVIFHVHQTK